MKNIEEQLKTLPHFQADALFKDTLKQRITVSMQPEKKWRLLPRYVLVFASVLVVLTSVTLLGYNSRQSSDTATIDAPSNMSLRQSEEDTGSAKNSAVIPNVQLATGFGFKVPETWKAKVGNQSQTHFAARFYLPTGDKTLTYVDIESQDKTKLVTNPWFTATNTKSTTVNGLGAEVAAGQEQFKESKRQIKQYTITRGPMVLVATLYRTSSDNVESQFDAFVQTINSTQPVSQHRFVKLAYAAEAIVGVPVEHFKKITVMADPLRESITSQDKPYQDGYAKFYKFDALNGQRLTTVALEDRSTNPGSFIRSELYDQDGNLIGNRADTRIEFNAPYTGTYYLVVHSFGGQSGGFLLKVFDVDQTTNQIYAKYADGSEKLIDYRTGDIIIGAREAAIIFQFTNPIGLSGNQVRYVREPEEFGSGLGLITVTLRTYQKQETYYGPWLTIEGQSAYEVQPKFTQVSANKLLIQPTVSDFFPVGHQIAIQEVYADEVYQNADVPVGSFGWVVRFFTEDRQTNPPSTSATPSAQQVP